MPTVLITGGSGLIGTELTRMLLLKGYSVINLSRSAKLKQAAQPAPGHIQQVFWNPAKQIIDEHSIKFADYIVNLAGAGVGDKRWTAERKKEIADSRIQAGNLISTSLKKFPNKVQAVINSSAIGWYGADPVIPNPHPFTEIMPADDGFLGVTCEAWEKSINDVTALNKRLVILRTGIVLSTKGGALKEFMNPLKFGVASILGSGKQVISWIHLEDIAAMYVYAIENEQLEGIFNAVAPHPVNNKTLVVELARKKNSFFIPAPVPSFVLKIVLGEMSVEVLKSTTVSAYKIEQAGFKFSFPTIDKAIDDLIAP